MGRTASGMVMWKSYWECCEDAVGRRKVRTKDWRLSSGLPFLLAITFEYGSFTFKVRSLKEPNDN